VNAWIGVILLGAGCALALLPVRSLIIGSAALLVILCALLKPVWALYLICFAIPFGSLVEFSVGGLSVGITEGLIGLLVATWLAKAIAFRHRIRLPSLCVALGIFIGTLLASLLNATDLAFAAKEILKWIEFLGVLAFVVNEVPLQEVKWLVACVLLAGVAQSLLGIYQFLTQSGPEFFVLMGRFMRAYGTFEQPNPFAGYLGLTAPVALALSSYMFGRYLKAQPAPWLKWLALGSLATIAMAIGMSWSRGAWLASGAMTVAIIIARSKKAAVALAVAVVLLVILGMLASFQLLPEFVTQRLTSFLPLLQIRDVSSVEITDENYASIERLAFWKAALAMWRDHPWIGVGIGNYAVAYPAYSLPKWRMALGHAHNYYLNIASETGLVGLLGYFLLWGTAFWQIGQRVRRALAGYPKALALGALGTLVYVSVHNVVDNLWVHNMYVLVAITVGLAYIPIHTGANAIDPETLSAHP
jgi:putative inorganic carbon (HCO3(-)) transporter